MKDSAMYRWFILIIAILCLIGIPLYNSYLQSETQENKKEIVLRFAPMKGAVLTDDLYHVLTERFAKDHPNVKIDLVLQPSSAVMHRDFLKNLLASGQFPDIMSMASPRDFVNSGLLMPLPIDKMDYLRSKDAQHFNGSPYVAVYKLMIGGFWYNKDIFHSLDLTPPQKYSDLLDICETIKASGITPIAIGIKDGWPQLVLASMLLSADILSKDPNWGMLRNEGKVSYSDMDFKYAISKYAELVQKYSGDSIEKLNYEQMRQFFYESKAAMLPLGSWVVGEMDTKNLDFDPGFFPVPEDESAQTVSVWQNEGLSISAYTAHPEECLDFIRFFMTDSIWYSTFLQTEAVFSNSSTKTIYPMSNLRKELGNLLVNLRPVEHWYDMTGDAALLPGLQSYFNEMTARIATGADIDVELNNFDSEWKRIRSDMSH